MTGYQIFRNTLILVATLLLVYVGLLTINVWIVLGTAILVASAVRPAIIWLQRWRVPQGIAILMVYGALGLGIITLALAVLPPVVNQMVSYLQNEDRLANRLIYAQAWTESFLSQNMGQDVNLGLDPDELRAAVNDLIDTIRITAPSLIADVSTLIGNTVLMVVMGVYWITSRERAEMFIVGLAPLARQGQARLILNEIETSLGAYVRALALKSLLVGLLCLLGLLIFRVPGAMTLTVLYAAATIIPIVGGFVGVVLVTLLALLSSPSSAVAVLLVTLVLQQIENYYLAPRIMARNGDFDEILVIVFIAVGFTLNGVTGALIAIPIAGSVAILLRHLILEPHKVRVQAVKTDGAILLAPDESVEGNV